jgi:ATP-dependent metalloprotease
MLAEIDVAMGGHVAEKLVIGKTEITSGCSSDLQVATQMAQQAVRYFGMFGDEVSYISRDKNNTSDTHNGDIDMLVKKILDDSFERVSKLLLTKDKELRELSKQLFLHDYLDADQMDRIISGKGLDPEAQTKVRDWDKEKDGEYLIKFD